MKHTPNAPALSLGNHIYLYRVLSEALGCGKQTFLPTVETALADADLSAVDLGFTTTRALLEELDDFITLTVFKGGRIYATVVAQPTWDAALEAEKQKKNRTAKPTKSFKRKKSDKQLKAVRPKHVVKPDPEPEPVVEPESKQEPTSALETEPEATSVTKSESPKEEVVTVPETSIEAKPVAETSAKPVIPDEPPIKLTITFVPEEHVNDASTDEQSAETTDSSQVPKAKASESDAKTAQERPTIPAIKSAQASETMFESASVPMSEPKMVKAEPAKPSIDNYPVDFSTEVYCPGPLLYELSGYFPYGADVLGIIGAYFMIAYDSDTADLRRDRATFPVRYIANGERKQLNVTIRKRHHGSPQTPCTSWSIDSFEQKA